MGLGASSARADRAISAFELFDRVRGMWLGQLIDNAAGRASEGLYSSSSPNPAEAVDWQIQQVWDAADDTDIEYIALHTLFTCGFDCTVSQIVDSFGRYYNWVESTINVGATVLALLYGGGHFENLAVQIRHDGQYSEPADLTVSEDLDRFRMYQAIRFRFTPTIGDAIRIVGAPGGSKRFTTILELEVEGDLCEDPNATTIDPTDQ